MWACRWRELRPIDFGGGGKGKERARAKGEYEMVSAKEEPG